MDILYRKEWFLEQKIEVWNWVKNWHFRKGLVHWFFQKSNFCCRCFSQKLFQKRSFFDIVDRNQSFLDQKVEVLTRAKKWTFFKGVCPWILSKNQTSSYRCFLHKLCQKKSLFDILNRKQSFLDQKIEVLKGQKKLTFPKGLVHEFCPNIELFVIGVFYRN